MELEQLINNIIMDTTADVALVFKCFKGNYNININENMKFPSASTIKILIMAAVMQEVEEGVFDLNHTIELKDEMKCGGAGIFSELDSGHRFNIRELLTAMIIQSDNAATNMLIDLVGMGKINKMAEELDMKSTKLNRKMMDFQAAKQGKENITNARNLSIILELIYREVLVDEPSSQIMLSILKKQQLEGGITKYLPEDIVIANKTGDLNKIEHDVGIVYHPQGEYILCVLTKNLNYNKEGKEIIGKISREIFNFLLSSKQ